MTVVVKKWVALSGEAKPMMVRIDEDGDLEIVKDNVELLYLTPCQVETLVHFWEENRDA